MHTYSSIYPDHLHVLVQILMTGNMAGKTQKKSEGVASPEHNKRGSTTMNMHSKAHMSMLIFNLSTTSS
jgi:hypothetical protein